MLRTGLRVLADGARALTGDVAKGAAKSAEASPARVERDLADGHLRVAQQSLGFFDAAGEQVAVGREAEGFLELAREVRRGDVADFCEAFDGPFLVGGGVHAVFGAQEAAEEVGVLTVRPRHLSPTGSAFATLAFSTSCPCLRSLGTRPAKSRRAPTPEPGTLSSTRPLLRDWASHPLLPKFNQPL